MPQLKQVVSLVGLCLENVVQNLDSYWCKHFLDSFHDHDSDHGHDHEGTDLHVPSPFDVIPARLVAKLINLLREKKLLRMHHLDLLLVSHLDHLDFSREETLIWDILPLAAKRCPVTDFLRPISTEASLKSLNLNYCKLYCRVYEQCISPLTKLQKLSVRGSNACDDLLFELGANFPDLQELDLNSCCNITNRGLKWLCVGDDNYPRVRLGQCRKLRKLHLTHTNVSKKGLHAALENLPELRIFECSDSVTTIANRHRSALESGHNTPQYKLIDLYYNPLFAGVYNPLSLSVAIGACPMVVKFSLVWSPNITDEDLLALVHLRHLRELQLSGCTDEQFSFTNGFSPVLQAHPHLEALQITDMYFVNIQLIAHFFKELSMLRLIRNNIYSVTWPEGLSKPEVIAPLPLKHLHVMGREPLRHLKYLLLSPVLVHVYLHGISNITDAALRYMLKKNRFEHLEHLEMQSCKNLSLEVIMELLELKNPLQALKVHDCKAITRRDFHVFESFVRKRKWLLTVKYYPVIVEDFPPQEKAVWGIILNFP